MNWHLLNYFWAEGKTVEVSRSRPYQKNDNAHVEQKNGTMCEGCWGISGSTIPNAWIR